MLRWIEAHLVRAVLVALAGAFRLYVLSALVFGYSAGAFVTTDVVRIAPQVAGPTAELPVEDNQRVAAGAPVLTVEAKRAERIPAFHGGNARVPVPF